LPEMKISYLCKRRYMGKDVIDDRYARLYEIARQLALLGHEVEAYCLDYSRDARDIRIEHDAAPGRLRWNSRSIGALALPRLAAYPHRLLQRAKRFSPDIVIGASDIPNVVLGAWLARRLNRPFVADLYDNFEGFGQARIPGMVSALRNAVRQARLVLTTSEPLQKLVIESYRATGEVISMPSTIDSAIFHPMPKSECRQALGLPSTGLLMGTAGGLHRDKGIEILYEAWKQISRAEPNVHLVLAGPHEDSLAPPSGERIHYLGSLPHDRIAKLFCALDVGVICILDTAFGRYCFPQKAYEMIACGLPVVAADVGAMGDLLRPSEEECLFLPGDPGSLARHVITQLHDQRRADVHIDDWRGVIGAIEPRLRQIALTPVAT
jgi:glycosyltransferase involved in cell wall biosynthesis